MEVVAQADMRVEMVLVDAQDLLEDRDRLGIEAALGEQVGDLRVRLDRRRRVATFQVKIAELQPRVRVFWLSLEITQVLLESLVEGTLLDVLLSVLERLAFASEGQVQILA